MTTRSPRRATRAGAPVPAALVAPALPPPHPVAAANRPGAAQAPVRAAPGTPLPPVHVLCEGMTPGLLKMASGMGEDAKGGLADQMLAIIKDLEDKAGARFLKYHPWKYHSRRATEGWLDWVVMSRCGFMVRELKKQPGKPDRAQQEWLDGWRGIGVDADLWKPCCLLSGRVARELTALAGIGGNR